MSGGGNTRPSIWSGAPVCRLEDMPPATACCFAAASWGGWEVHKLLSKAALRLRHLTTLTLTCCSVLSGSQPVDWQAAALSGEARTAPACRHSHAPPPGG